MAEEADLEPRVKPRGLIPARRLLDGRESERVVELDEAEEHVAERATRREQNTGVARLGTGRGGPASAPAHVSTSPADP